MRKRFLIMILMAAFAAGVVPVAAEPVPIDEWNVPWEGSRPRDPYVDPKGRVWFCGQKSGYLAYLEPDSGEFKKFELGAGAGPHNLIVEDNGMVWFAGNRNAYIGKLHPDTGEITSYPMPDPKAHDPHTLIFDGAGNIWFTVQGGNFIGRLAMQSGVIDLVAVPTADARPYGIAVDADKRPWAVLFASNKLATVDPRTLELTEYELPRQEARPRRIGITSDGAVWYGDYAHGMLGRFDPQSRTFKEWPLPGGKQAGPYAMAVDDRDRVWVAETGEMPNRLVGFDPEKEKFFSVTDVPSGGGSVRHMVFHAPDGVIWFGADTDRIGRADIGKAP